MHVHPIAVSKSVPDDARVAWAGGRPADEDAHAVWDALTRLGLTRAGAVVEQVADVLFRRDLARFGAAADIGFFQSFYRAYARAVLARLAGTCVRVGDGSAS